MSRRFRANREDTIVGDSQLFVSSALTIEITDTENQVYIKWLGKSIDRNPGKFITPILANVLMQGGDGRKQIVLDFRAIEYMNSSTITPVIKVLERAKSSTARMSVRYDQTAKWQDLIFSALRIFQTEDGRIEIKGI